MTNLQRKFRKVLNKKQNVPVKVSGILGNGVGIVETGTENRVYVRIGDVSTTAICESVPHINELPVWVGYNIYDPSVLRILSMRLVDVNEDQQAELGAHAETHRYFGSGIGGGTDVLWVDHRQIMALRIFATTNVFEIAVFPGVVYINGLPKLIGTLNASGTYKAATIDLGAYVVTTEDKCRLVLITINSSGALVATAGSEVNISALNTENDMPAIPAGTRWVLGAVRLYYGQSDIIEHRDNSDIIDMRWPMWHSHDGTELELAVNDLSDVAITAPADGETLIYDSATEMWINQTLTEAGISAIDHTHTESQITDLDHDATKIDGIAVDLTGISNGQAPIYDSATSTLKAGDAGSSLTIEEVDGTPSVVSVSKIKVTNGTLTDDGSGVVTVNFGSAATDGSAIHDNEAGEIHAITEKTALADDDEFILEDSADSYNKKRVKVSNLPAGASGGIDILEVQVFM